jgi:hypothetical protein
MTNMRIVSGRILLVGLLLSCSATAAPFAYSANNGCNTVPGIETPDNPVTAPGSFGAREK